MQISDIRSQKLPRFYIRGNEIIYALADAFSRFLRSQDERHRNVFIRRYWFGDSLSQIAELYGMKEKTVATYLFRTRKKLKAFLQKEGYDYE